MHGHRLTRYPDNSLLVLRGLKEERVVASAV